MHVMSANSLLQLYTWWLWWC